MINVSCLYFSTKQLTIECSMSKGEIAKYLILRTIGNFLVLFALFGVGMTFGPALYFEVSYRIDTARGIRYAVASESISPATTPTGFPVPAQSPHFNGFAANENVRILIPKDTQFSILIPKIGANAQVFPNVDVNSETEYLRVLSQGVAHAKGTVFPGMKGNIYLFAHSTDNFWNVGRYNALFYLLKDLAPGDEVIVFFENVRHDYVVTNSKIVDDLEVGPIMNAKTGQEQLVLQTCWPPGTSWKRLLIFAKPK